MGLEPYLILRSGACEEDPGMIGNLLPSRMVGAHIRLAGNGPSQPDILSQLEGELKGSGKNPYVFPSGGSNSRGSWGYIEAIRELESQMKASNMAPFDILYFACGSGGTGAGLALANHLSGGRVAKKVVGIAVDDDAKTFYDKMEEKIYPGIYYLSLTLLSTSSNPTMAWS